MKKRLVCVVLLPAFLLLAGCATGRAWYYPYGPAYFEEEPGPRTIKDYLSQSRPEQLDAEVDR
jgi:hypothetical protein